MRGVFLILIWAASALAVSELEHSAPLPSPTSSQTEHLQREKKENLDSPNAERLGQERNAAQPLEQNYQRDRGFEPSSYVTSSGQNYLLQRGFTASDYVQSPVIGSQQYQGALAGEVPEGRYGKAGVSFLDLPEDGVESLVPAGVPIRYLMYHPRSSRYQVINNVQYAEEPAQVGVEYLPVQVVPFEQYKYPGTPERPKTVNPNPRTQSVRKLESPPAVHYLENVALPGFQPYSTPVYSYTPQQLIRILRYAPQHKK